MAQIIAITNQKGGVGKTTSAINLSTYLAAMGRFVLLVDLDPQTNATSGIGSASKISTSLYDVLINQAPLQDALYAGALPNHKILPSSSQLAGATVELVGRKRREFLLSDILLEARNDYDYIIIDCPPSLDLLTVNGLVAANKILIPVQAEYYALEGLGNLLNTINLVQNNLKQDLKILGALITMYDKRNRLSRQVLDELYQHFPHKIFRSVIPRNVRLSEAPSFGQSILHYDGGSKGARAYERLAREVAEECGY